MNNNDFVNNFFYDSDSDDELNNANKMAIVATIVSLLETTDGRHTGSVKGRRTIERNLLRGNEHLYQDYFAEQPTYNEDLFRRRFRMNCDLFLRIVEGVKGGNDHFRQRRNAAGKLGLSTLQKVTAAIRLLAYGTAADSFDEYLRFSASTSKQCLINFCETVIAVYGETYLRRPNEDDIARLFQTAEERNFPGMLGSLDCMHWQWKNCPTAGHGMYQRKEGEPTVILEAVASADLWIWHSFFGLPGSLNDINVLQRSPLMTHMAEGNGPSTSFTVNGHHYERGYYLTDGIYPRYSPFIKTINAPQGSDQEVN